MKNLLTAILFFSAFLIAGAQVVETFPSIPTMSGPIQIFFHTDRETGALKNYTGDIYTHTGVIIEGNPAWQHVIGTWGVNTSQPKLYYQGDYTYTMTVTPDIATFYPGMTGTEKVIKLAFVFRNAAGSMQTADIFINVFEIGLNVAFINPGKETLILELNEEIHITASATLADSLLLYVNGLFVSKSEDPELLQDTILADTYGGYWAKVVAYDMPGSVADSFYFFVKKDPLIAEVPAGMNDGINYTGETTATLVLTAPGKNDAFVVGDFNDWTICDDGYMNQTPDAKKFWIDLTGIPAGEEQRFQYLVEGTIRIGDPYAVKVLDPWNDQYITETTYPGLIAYPAGLTTGMVSVLQTSAPEYNWTNTGFQRPAKDELVIYELLVRDFLATHHYKTLIDTLDYLDRMGINAIELMPVNEFDGNINWGYAPAYYLAPDKYYGTEYDLRAFIDSCHGRGIAVILDVVLNHSTGNSPMAALYWDNSNNNVTAENPWYNVVPTHDYNVFHDFNHESSYTREFSKRVMSHWIEEYRIDGYRFDLSKGFTQNNTLGNVAAWGAYDASRVALWKMYVDHIWSVDPGFYVILEHFADNSEEKELSDYGMMLWGNMNHQYTEGSMGYASDFTWTFYQSRGWNEPHLISYMESHDEERMQYKNRSFGLTTSTYNIKDLDTGLERIILSATFFFTVPGPKMIWQFGELGYDYSINYIGRTDPKPIKWDYYTVNQRRRVYDSFAALIKLRSSEPAFSDGTYTLTQEGKKKRINISHQSMNVMVMGNFDVATGLMSTGFNHTGWWYEFFTGDSLNVTSTSDVMSLKAGAYRIYTDKKLQKPDITVSVDDVFDERDNSWVNIYPNPVRDILGIRIEALRSGEMYNAELLDLTGQTVLSFIFDSSSPDHQYDLSQLPRGIYFLRIHNSRRVAVKKIIKTE